MIACVCFVCCSRVRVVVFSSSYIHTCACLGLFFSKEGDGATKGGKEYMCVCFVCFICGGGCAVVLYVLSVRIYWCVVVWVFCMCVLPFLPLSLCKSSAGRGHIGQAQVRTKTKKETRSRSSRIFNKESYMCFLLSIGCFLGWGGGQMGGVGRFLGQPCPTPHDKYTTFLWHKKKSGGCSINTETR